MFSSERWERAKMRLVRPLPSRINPRRRCSVSMEMLPSWLASYRAKKRTRRARSVYRSNIQPAYVKADSVVVTRKLTTLYGILEPPGLESEDLIAGGGQPRIMRRDERRQAA